MKIFRSKYFFVFLLFAAFPAHDLFAQVEMGCSYCGTKGWSCETHKSSCPYACKTSNSSGGSGSYTGPTQQQIEEQQRQQKLQQEAEQKRLEELQKKHDEMMNMMLPLPDFDGSGTKSGSNGNDLEFSKPEQGGTVDLNHEPMGLDEKMTVDPRFSLTKQMCSTSKERRDKLLKDNERMNAVVVKLKTELTKVAGLNKQLKEDKKEFDDIRAEAVKGTLSDVLDAVPIEGMAKKLGELPEYKKYVEQLEKYFEAIKNINDGSTALSATIGTMKSKEEAEKIKNSVEAMGKYKDVLLSVSTIPAEEKKYLDALGKMAEAIAKASMTQCKDCKNLTNAEISTYVGDGLVSSLKIVGVYAPPVRIAVAIESLGERVATGIITQQADEAINNALNKNFDANLYLNIKISQLNSIMDGNKKTIADDDRIVKGYEEYNHTTCCGPCPK